MSIIAWIIIAAVVIVGAIALIGWFYVRATNEVSLVRTGIGGRKVAVAGGIIAIPYFHEIAKVNMQTLRLDVTRNGESALITKDRLRVDVTAEFYASVKSDSASIARAAQTLGNRTFNRDELRALIEGMMVDALRSSAAQMTMDELHEGRTAFVQQVKGLLKEVLGNYGLQLNNVSLTDLDQTQFSKLDEDNAFNAVGMRKLAEVIAKSKKERAEIASESAVSVRRTEMEAARKRLEIELEQRRAEIAQQQEIETLSADQIAEVARKKAESEREASQARIAMERAIQTAEIAREEALYLAEQDRQIRINSKAQEESRARIEADSVRVDAIKSTEAVETARAKAEAERRAAINLISAEGSAKAKAAADQLSAQADLQVAKSRAARVREDSEAQKFHLLAEAEATRAQLEAENSRSNALIAMELEKARLEAMPKIVAEMVKPAEKISAIHVNHMTGFGGGIRESGDRAEKTVMGHTMDSIMEMAVQMPVLRKIGDQLGVDFDQSLNPKKSDEDS